MLRRVTLTIATALVLAVAVLAMRYGTYTLVLTVATLVAAGIAAHHLDSRVLNLRGPRR